MLSQDVNEFAFAFIAPLTTQNAGDLTQRVDSSQSGRSRLGYSEGGGGGRSVQGAATHDDVSGTGKGEGIETNMVIPETTPCGGEWVGIEGCD